MIKQIELVGQLDPSGDYNVLQAIYEERTFVLLVIDDGERTSDAINTSGSYVTISIGSTSTEEGYVSLLDGNRLFDKQVMAFNQNGEVISSKAMTKDDYISAVLWDMPYKKSDNIERGTAWMQGLNEFMKTINKNG